MAEGAAMVFRCGTCPDEFTDAAELDEHKRTGHAPPTAGKAAKPCPRCDADLDDEGDCTQCPYKSKAADDKPDAKPKNVVGDKTPKDRRETRRAVASSLVGATAGAALGAAVGKADDESINLHVMLYGDGAVYGASRKPAAAHKDYWRQFFSDLDYASQGREAWQLVEAEVPADVAERLEAHGTSSQWYNDGYDARRALFQADRNLPEKVARELGGTGDHDPQFHGGKTEGKAASVHLYVMLYGDGQVYGATRESRGRNTDGGPNSHWQQFFSELSNGSEGPEPWQLIEADVPEALAKELENPRSDLNLHGDGYDARKALFEADPAAKTRTSYAMGGTGHMEPEYLGDEGDKVAPDDSEDGGEWGKASKDDEATNMDDDGDAELLTTLWGKSEPDADAARELVLYIENDGDLYRQQHVPIQTNLMRKRRKGTYDFEKSITLFGYLTDAGAQKYTKEYSTPGPNGSYGIFDKATRMAAARDLAEAFRSEADLGNYDDLDLKPGGKAMPTRGKDAHDDLVDDLLDALKPVCEPGGAIQRAARGLRGVMSESRAIVIMQTYGRLATKGKAGDGKVEGKAAATAASLKARGFTVTVEALPEDSDPEGHFGEREDAEWARQQLAGGNEWGRCIVKVTVEKDGIEGTDYLGGCAYKSKAAFMRGGGYYDDMVAAAYDDYKAKVKTMKEKVARADLDGKADGKATEDEGDEPDAEPVVEPNDEEGKASDDDHMAECSDCGNRFDTRVSGYEDTSKCGRCWGRINKDEGKAAEDDDEGPLPSTVDSPAVKAQVLAAATNLLRRKDLQANFEHGHWWVTDPRTGAQWDAVDASGPGSKDGFAFEEVTEDDDDVDDEEGKAEGKAKPVPPHSKSKPQCPCCTEPHAARIVGGKARKCRACARGECPRPAAAILIVGKDEPASKRPIRFNFGKATDYDPDTFQVGEDHEGRGFHGIWARRKGGKADHEALEMCGILMPRDKFPDEGKAEKLAKAFAKEHGFEEPVKE